MNRERMKRLARIWNGTPADRRFHVGGTLAVRLDDGGPVLPLLELTDAQIDQLASGVEVTR